MSSRRGCKTTGKSTFCRTDRGGPRHDRRLRSDQDVPDDGGSAVPDQRRGQPGRPGDRLPHRKHHHQLLIVSQWQDPAESDRHIHWTREFWQATHRFAGVGAYVNELGLDDGDDRVRSAYGANYERLVALKNTYDPTNFFRLNPNVKPTL